MGLPPPPFYIDLPQTKVHTYLIEGGITGSYEFKVIVIPEPPPIICIHIS